MKQMVSSLKTWVNRNLYVVYYLFLFFINLGVFLRMHVLYNLTAFNVFAYIITWSLVNLILVVLAIISINIQDIYWYLVVSMSTFMMIFTFLSYASITNFTVLPLNIIPFALFILMVGSMSSLLVMIFDTVRCVKLIKKFSKIHKKKNIFLAFSNIIKVILVGVWISLATLVLIVVVGVCIALIRNSKLSNFLAFVVGFFVVYLAMRLFQALFDQDSFCFNGSDGYLFWFFALTSFFPVALLLSPRLYIVFFDFNLRLFVFALLLMMILLSLRVSSGKLKCAVVRNRRVYLHYKNASNRVFMLFMSVGLFWIVAEVVSSSFIDSQKILQIFGVILAISSARWIMEGKELDVGKLATALALFSILITITLSPIYFSFDPVCLTYGKDSVHANSGWLSEKGIEIAKRLNIISSSPLSFSSSNFRVLATLTLSSESATLTYFILTDDKNIYIDSSICVAGNKSVAAMFTPPPNKYRVIRQQTNLTVGDCIPVKDTYIWNVSATTTTYYIDMISSDGKRECRLKWEMPKTSFTATLVRPLTVKDVYLEEVKPYQSDAQPLPDLIH